MRILLTGSSGQVGHELVRLAEELGWSIVALRHEELDIRDEMAVNHVVREQRDLAAVINAAAYTAVDRAEEESELAFGVNCDGPGYLATACAEVGIPLLHLSTNYVFDGEKTSPYLETDAAAPVNTYGASKLGGEERVRERLERHLIVRTSWVFSPHGNNFVKTILRLGRERDTLTIVADQHGCPTAARDIAVAIAKLVLRISETRFDSWGTYHYCGAPPTNWFEFAQEIFRYTGVREEIRVCELRPIPSSMYPTPAARPAYTVLDCTRIRRVFGLDRPPWKARLGETVDRIIGAAT